MKAAFSTHALVRIQPEAFLCHRTKFPVNRVGGGFSSCSPRGPGAASAAVFPSWTCANQRPRCKQRGINLAAPQGAGYLVSAPLRSVLTVRHWRTAPSRHSSNIHASMDIFLIARVNKKMPSAYQLPCPSLMRGEGIFLRASRLRSSSFLSASCAPAGGFCVTGRNFL